MLKNFSTSVAALTIFFLIASLGLCATPPSGNAVATIQGSVTVCVAEGTMTPRACNATGAMALVTSVLEIGRVSWDANGNACTAGTETISVPGTSVTITQDVTLVGKVATYDPATQTGTATVIGYAGGSCSGPVFNNKGATERSTSNVRFLISQGGTRMDGIVTKIQFPAVELGAVSLSGTAIKQ